MTTASKIERRTLGKSGIEVPIIGIGLWAIGGTSWGETDDQQSLRTIDAALDLGVNFFDTADVYGDGHSEELLGRAMHGRRDKFIVATKVGWRGFDDETQRSAYDTVDKLIAAVESNLRRLQTDYVDLLQNHINFREPHMEIFLEAFQKLQQQGKIRAYGVSTSDFDYLKAFNADGQCAALQIDYSILNRTPEREIFPYCREHDIGVLTRGSLAMGILTGKFTPETRFEEGDFRRRWHENPDEHATFLDDLQKVEMLRELTDGRSLAQLALQFVTSNTTVTATIPGAKSPRQVQENVKAALLPGLSDAELERIDEIVAPGGGRKIWPA
jgi:aryl-alcohol dehydrogenase-like predicted oxidoreductase